MKKLTLLMLGLILSGCTVYTHYPAQNVPPAERYECWSTYDGVRCYDKQIRRYYRYHHSHPMYSYWYGHVTITRHYNERRVERRPEYKAPARRVIPRSDPRVRTPEPRSPETRRPSQRRPEVRPPPTNRPPVRRPPPRTERKTKPRGGNN